MVLDTSAVLAILLQEPDSRTFAEAIAGASECLISAASVLETAIVLRSRKGGQAMDELEAFLTEAGAVVTPLDLRQVRAAYDAWLRFGKGNHAARLNFGDCCSYALAHSLQEPLLFKGKDFSETDLVSAL